MTAIDAKTGEVVDKIPRNNVFGLNFYTKVIPLMDGAFANMGGDNSLLMMLALSGNGEMNSDMMLPLMLMNSGGDGLFKLPAPKKSKKGKKNKKRKKMKKAIRKMIKEAICEADKEKKEAMADATTEDIYEEA